MNNLYKSPKERLKKYNSLMIDEEEFIVRKKEWKNFQENQKNLLKLSKVLPPNSLSLKFSDLVEMDEIKKKLNLYVENFDKKFNKVHLYFWSTENGTQKTTTASILAKELSLKGKNVNFVLMSDLSKILVKEAFETEVSDKVNDFLNCDFLVIDDSFDAKKMTIYKSGYQIPFLDTFLRKRLETVGKATCFTSNIRLESINEEVFGTSIVKLMERSVLDPFNFTCHYSKKNDFNPQDLWS